MAYLVYPGATHTRFSHSIGVLCVANDLAENAGLGQERVRYVRLAALLHDIGHGPFSHVSEYVLLKHNTDIEDTPIEELHEAIGLKVIEKVFLGENIIDDPTFREIRGILTGGPRAGEAKKDSIEHDIVSGPIDADKMDYLLRDSYFCGVKYGVYDVERLALSAGKFEDPDYNTIHLAFNAEDVYAVDQFIFAKHNMNTQVYRHRIRRIADAMLQRCILLSLAEENAELAQLYSLPIEDLGEEEYIERYLKYDDERIVQAVLKGPNGQAKELMQRLRERKLMKQVFKGAIQYCTGLNTEEILKKANAQEEFPELEADLADACSISDKHLVFVEVWQQRSPRRPSPETTIDPQMIYMIGEPGKHKSYDQVSQVFRHGELPGDDMLYVYMPVDARGSYTKRNRYKKLHKTICQVLGFESDAQSATGSNQ